MRTCSHRSCPCRSTDCSLPGRQAGTGPRPQRRGGRSAGLPAWLGPLALLSFELITRGDGALAGPARSVRVTSYQELAEGQDNGVLLTSQGEVRVGVSATRLNLPSPADDSVRAMVAAADGTVYVGTGGESAAVHIYKQGQLRVHATLAAGTWVTALCLLDGHPGHVLAATAQDGRIFDIGPDGKPQLWAQVEADHVWGLVRDSGVTYVATGPGRLWAIADKDAGPGRADASKARARKILDTGAKQFLALARGDDGALYVGTADDAVLYRIEPLRDGREPVARALHDFAGNEVRAIVARAGFIYVAVNDMQRGDSGSHGIKLIAPAAGSAPGVKPTAPTPPGLPSAASTVEKKGKGALFRIDDAGRVEQLHAVVDGFYNALHLDAAGNLYAAASAPGGRGRVFEVKPDRTVLTLVELKESDVLALSLPLAGGERLLGTGNSAAVYKLSEGPPKDPSYQSRVFDAQAIAHWGALRYLGQGELRVETRTGNLSKPDATWSAWQPLRAPTRLVATGEQLGKVSSPAGRYLQARFLFADRAVLSDFTVHYQPVNQRARITDILVGEDPTGRVARGIKPASLLRPKTPLVKLRWKIENPDDDDLNYRVYIRPAASPAGLVGNEGARPAGASGPGRSAGSASAAPAAPAVLGATAPSASEVGWLRISGTEPLTRAELDWNTDTVGDGLYELKVVVSDERSNPPELVQSSDLTSAPFIIDNRRPELRELRWNAATSTLSGEALDAVSPITELAYSLDGGDFFPIAPRDGVLDESSEEFQVRLPRLAAAGTAPNTTPSPAPGTSHLVLVRASDAADNVSTVQLVIQVK